jgi:hypothetical protein
MSQIYGMLKNPAITWKLDHRLNLPAISCPISSLTNRSLTPAWCGAPLEMMEETKSGAQRACSLRPRCIGETRTAKPVYSQSGDAAQNNTVVIPISMIQNPRFQLPLALKKLKNWRNERFVSFKTVAKRERAVTWWNPSAQTCPVLDSFSFVPVLTLPHRTCLHSVSCNQPTATSALDSYKKLLV